MVFASLHPAEGGRVAVFAAPWSDRTAVEVIAAAGGPILTTDARGWIAVSESPDSDFVQHLYGSGAGFVASALVAAACMSLGWMSKGTENE
ncbi:MAG: hypothetical protein JJ902_00735 [Roseibium sp.]|nr:hypothetical protein [Roseibium sp.]